MAAPTPVSKTFWDGTRGMTRWYAAWTTTDNFTDQVVVDVSALDPAPTSVKVRSIHAILNGVIDASLEFDATTDELIDHFLGQSDMTNTIFRDYRDGPSNGYVPTDSATGFTGDIMLTTAAAANGLELNLLIIFQKNS